MKVLVLQLKRIGDAILTAPALASLRQALPDAHITLVLSGAAATLGPAFAMVDEVVTLRQGKLNLASWKRALTGKFDACLDFTGNDRSAALALASRAKFRVGYEKFARNFLRRRCLNRLCAASVRYLHTIDFHHALVSDALVALGCCQPSLPPDFGHLQIPKNLQLPELPDQFALVHPGTAKEEKYWPPQHWQSVIRHLSNKLPIVLTGSSDPFEQSHLAHFREGCLDLSGKLSLLQTMAVIAQSRIALGVDSAAMHLAASFQLPQVVLFGPTNPYHWRPRHPRAKVLLAGQGDTPNFTPKAAGAPMTDLPAGLVCEAADALLAAD